MPRNPEVTQQRLIDATAEIMASVGIAGLRVDQIAQRTGVNKRMIYHYFANKEGLARRVLAEQVHCLCIGLPNLEEDLASFLRRELMADVGISERSAVPGTEQMRLAAKVVLRGFMDGYGSGRRLPEAQWRTLFPPLLRLAVHETLDLDAESERSLSPKSTEQKPRYQLRPGFRRE
ncbi:MAG: helix-turn-helix domain-containing protein [Pseudomonadota bacterium]|nr:helix-turn-helix domain-containing protein [Pseudomonadota bacterium]